VTSLPADWRISLSPGCPRRVHGQGSGRVQESHARAPARIGVAVLSTVLALAASPGVARAASFTLSNQASCKALPTPAAYVVFFLLFSISLMSGDGSATHAARTFPFELPGGTP
jgi:hypothetical protein